ncbi:N-acetylmuramoyl-L-alanine amidase [Herbinix luporum]|jgi:N-acetylmuramoyl-L-alanine amidase|uniref:Putative membrane protein n=1 Tax=Herbinix luporum TaxID=1679721 RepID=A0A0K8J2Y9_9FIRM|nr:N-acetylmuramoyl-L-alanine amidase [Herbinix luporum]MDI9487979.1 N-acetylmuramoyl-L-alanine amidase [Bacillota bacterium]CUH91719.1 putative membrane protein [Herbinix luporum]HHT57366.1 N-acetylmuramoyl-L-alanine amidase [Herbinix luporum]
MKRKYFSILFLLLIFAARVISSDKSVKVMRNLFEENKIEGEKTKVTIVIDPGHGGRDPGKVGVNGALEKDVNLAIALKLKDLLEQNDINVIMTRTEDIGLYSETDSNKKRVDLNKRVEIINNSDAAFAISIHQNSFSQENVKGAQVFYHIQSEEGRVLAGILQEQIKETINDGNHRKAKSNTNYYMLKHTLCPLVIVECGYLSNWTEAKLLVDEDYQEKMAWAIHLGILKYLNINKN